MKITKKNGSVVLYDDEKVIRSILKANAEAPGEEITRKKAAVFADEVFNRITREHDVIRTQDVRDCVARGICKVNFATELRKAFTDACRKLAEDDPKAFDPKVFCKAGMAAVKELVMSRMKVCGCDGKA